MQLIKCDRDRDGKGHNKVKGEAGWVDVEVKLVLDTDDVTGP